ncbi:MAG: hypothetical protein IJL87_04840 [Clostridia bacterium]|nr:hypothetical protein [Clostridia bacterium]
MKRNWFRLDNAALIFPAIIGRKWSNAFRLSVTLAETVDPEILAQAAKDMRPRFPTCFVRLKTGFFWYYLEEISSAGCVHEEYAYPLTYMSRTELKKSCIRILYFKNRIAVEIFHSVTDGTGGLIFLQNLTARYLELKYGVTAEKSGYLVDLSMPPKKEDLRDCFPLHSSKYSLTRHESNAYRLSGTPETDGYRHLITGVCPTKALLEKAHEHGATLNTFLSAVMAEAICEIQRDTLDERGWKPVKITVPVNLRKMYKEYTMRNFALTLNVGFDPRYGSYTLDELCSLLTHQIAAEATPQKMSGDIAANVKPQKNPIIRVMPLPVKSAVMRAVYSARGEKRGCINISNLGQSDMPAQYAEYIERFEFIIGVQQTYPNNCSVISFGENTYINMIRSIKESELERRFFSRLVELGVPVEIEYDEKGRR